MAKGGGKKMVERKDWCSESAFHVLGKLGMVVEIFEDFYCRNVVKKPEVRAEMRQKTEVEMIGVFQEVKPFTKKLILQ